VSSIIGTGFIAWTWSSAERVGPASALAGPTPSPPTVGEIGVSGVRLQPGFADSPVWGKGRAGRFRLAGVPGLHVDLRGAAIHRYVTPCAVRRATPAWRSR
jgi:hypothetical protein